MQALHFLRNGPQAFVILYSFIPSAALITRIKFVLEVINNLNDSDSLNCANIANKNKNTQNKNNNSFQSYGNNSQRTTIIELRA